MSNRKILLFFLLTFFTLKSRAAVFVVTSNADSGPGTLRDALTQAAANGSATKDYINFNMADASIAGRTITLMAQLPFVTSNLVIDGTTQPGSGLGVSDAKIILQPGPPAINTDPYNALVLYNVNGFELYGLYIRDFNYDISYQSSQGGFFDVTSAICVATSHNIQVGAPGKGNVFANVGHVFQTIILSVVDNQPPAFGTENLKFYSNICGFEPDGTTIRGTPDSFGTGFLNISSDKGEIDIGGDDIAERNIFGNANTCITQSTFFSSSYPLTINIKNNYFDYNINGQPTPFRASSFDGNIHTMLLGQASNSSTPPYTINIINNRMQYFDEIYIARIQGAITFKGNSILYNPAPVYTPKELPQFIFQSDAAITIGGEQPGDANSIYGTQISAYSKKSVLIQHNSIYCVNVMSPQGVYLPDPQIAGLLPKIAISNVSATNISGTATPLSKVELFEDDDCILCQPLTYFATVTADANGNWSYTGPINKGIIASATLNGFTSTFTGSATLTQSTLIQSSCGNPGSFTNLAFTNSGGYVVKNAQGQVINNATLNNLAPGKYTLTAENGTCSTDYPFAILNATPKIDDSKKKIIAPSCGKLGSITGLSLANTDVLALDPNAYKIVWLDAGNNPIGNNLDLLNVAAGTYTLQVTYIKDNCTTNYNVTVTNATGPALDQSNVQIKPSTCSDPNGSITNIKVTGISGTAKYKWLDNLQQLVGTTVDLINQAAGVYQLQVTDDSQCGPIFSTYLSIPMINVLSLDESKATVNPATCGQANASITGIFVTGATSYKWTNALTGEDYTTTTADLTSVPPGTYILTIANGICIKQSSPHIVTAIQPVALVTASVQLTGDECSGNSGSIKGIAAQYGSPPYTFVWTDAAGKPISQTADLTNVGAGTYTLTVTDATACQATTTYSLQNHDAIISPPAVNDIQLCGPGAAILRVKNPSSGYSYRLYGTGTAPLDEQANGIFKITANANSTFYVSQFLGECESIRTQAHVTIGIAGIDIANTITPNGDGINDYWTIKNIENYPGALIQIFNRYGQKVYESKGYAVPFDGTYNNQKLATGVYYYIINLENRCNLLSGSLTIIR